MAMMLLVSGLLLTVPAIYGRSLPGEDPCQIVITKDGHKIINGSAAVAFTGRLNQVLCSLQCPGIHIPPALTWFKGDREEQGGKKIPEAIRRVATSTTAAKRISWLNIWNMKDSDMGRYTCVGYKDGYGMLWASLDLEYECDEGNEFLCDNKCLPKSYRCNGKVDCEGGHDEEECPSIHDCPTGEDACKDTTTPPTPTSTTSPSTTPTTTEGTACSNEDFKCNNDTCIPKANFCNGEPDCEDGEDELNCTTTVDYSTTANMASISEEDMKLLEMVKACKLETGDEFENFMKQHEKTCGEAKKSKAANAFQIPKISTFFGEKGTQRCKDDQFKCNDGSCIDNSSVNNGFPDCDNGEDESTQRCKDDQFKCNDGSCIDNSSVNNGFPDCDNGEDESTQGCKDDQFECNDGSCIDNSSVNNGFPDCDNAEDETATRTCLEGQILCSDKSHCIAPSDVCDGKDDCNDHGGEANCPPTKEQAEAFTNV